MNVDNYKSLQAQRKNRFHTFHRPMEDLKFQGFVALSSTEKLHSYIPLGNNSWHLKDWNPCHNMGNDVRGRENIFQLDKKSNLY